MCAGLNSYIIHRFFHGESDVLATFVTANRRQFSLVDCSSFESMRRLGVRTVFAFDPHIAEQGFDLIPPF